MPLGSPVTSRFLIGAFDVRFGSLSLAGRLSPTQSVGISDRIGLAVNDLRVNWMTGEAQHSRPALVGTNLSVKFSFRELSLRNLQAAMGGATVDAPLGSTTLFRATLGTAATVDADATSLSFPSATASHTGALVAGSTISLSPASDPGRVTVHRVTSKSTVGDDLVVGVEPGTAAAFQAGEAVEARQVRPLTAPAADTPLTLRIVQKDRATGFPLVWDFWKVSLDADRSFDITADEFFSGELAFTVEHPLASELAEGGALEHVAGTVAANPLFRYAAIADLD